MQDNCTAQKMKFSIKDFFRKCDQTGNGNSLMENCSVQWAVTTVVALFMCHDFQV